MNYKFVEVLLEEEKEVLKNFLIQFNLTYEEDINISYLVYDQNKLIATASAANNVLKCIAIDEGYQGKQLMNTLLSMLINRLSYEGITHYFVYTKLELYPLFESLNMNLISKTDEVALLEGGTSNIKDTLTKIKKDYQVSDFPKAAVVMNANPFTNGHFYLVDEALKENKEVLLFVVEEDSSSFPFDDRFEIIKNTFNDEPKVTVLPTSVYSVSKQTFPTYFLEEGQDPTSIYAKLDAQIFKEYYMPIFNITTRYVGSEPYSKTTNVYNESLIEILNNDVIVKPRMKYHNEYISASKVRDCIRDDNLELIKELVPNETYKYLQSGKGKQVSKKLKKHNNRH